MWKKITVVAGGMALAVSLPFVALALTTEEFPDVLVPADAVAETVQVTTATQVAVEAQVAAELEPVEPTGPWVSPNAVDPIAIQQAEQTMVRQQLRVHAETGPIDGVEPIQQRLHVDDPLGMGPGSDNASQSQNMGNGNPDAPMAGPGTGECINDGVDCPNAGDPSLMNQNMGNGNPDAPMAGAGTGECTNDGVDCPNAGDPSLMNQNMGNGNPDAPMAGAGTGDPADCPNDGQPIGGEGAGTAGRGGNNG